VRDVWRLDERSRLRLERFRAAALGRAVDLSRVRLVGGDAGAAVTGIARAAGLTLGATIFLDRAGSRALAARVGADGRLARGGALEALDALLVHECVHVAQYASDGTAPFLRIYLFSYFTNLRKEASLRELARLAAYRDIGYELEATAIERLWSALAAGDGRL
jgi:hypothetical protein